MDKQEWWAIFNQNQVDLRMLVQKYHPASNSPRPSIPITADAAEAACKQIRENIKATTPFDVLVTFDAAVHNNQANVLCNILTQTWFGMPEGASVREEPGFHSLCYLCEGADEDDE